MSTRSEKPFDASFTHRERYGILKGSDTSTVVLVDGQEFPAEVLGRNGPRTQVRFVRDGGTFVRWFDTADLRDGQTTTSLNQGVDAGQ